MNEKIICAITDFIANRSSKTLDGNSKHKDLIREYKKGADDYEILKYGVAVIYYNFTKTAVLVVAAAVLGILPHALAFMLVFGSLRRFARGLHLKNNVLCTIIGFANYIAGIYAALNVTMGLVPSIVIYLACMLLNLIYTPSPTENKPIKKQDRLPLKIKTMLVMAALFVLLLVIGGNAFRNIIVIATTIETMYILPFTYKIFKEKRS